MNGSGVFEASVHPEGGAHHGEDVLVDRADDVGTAAGGRGGAEGGDLEDAGVGVGDRPDSGAGF